MTLGDLDLRQAWTAKQPSPREWNVFVCFYSTARASYAELSDGGGPFGFDIQTALQIDRLVEVLPVDGIVETGSHRGDTAEYLARSYPALPVRTCEIDPPAAAFTRHRLRKLPNAEAHLGDSTEMIEMMSSDLSYPLFYLDAHWRDEWPLASELARLDRGIVAIHDFHIGHPSFGSDSYSGVRCGPELIGRLMPGLETMYVGNPYAGYPFPCLQTARRCGTGYVSIDSDILAADGGSHYFLAVPLSPVRLPDWPSENSAARRP